MQLTTRSKSLLLSFSPCVLRRSDQDQPAVRAQHSQHVCPGARGIHRRAADHHVWQVDASSARSSACPRVAQRLRCSKWPVAPVGACRCRDCAAVLEEYDEETLCLAVVALSMFIHLSPDLAAPMLLDIMQSVGRYSHSSRPHPHAALQR